MSSTPEKVILFVFFLSCLLLLTRKQIWRSDGFIEYQVAEGFIKTGRLDLPAGQERDDPRVQEGRGGHYYAIYGLGQSIWFALTIQLDRLCIWLLNLLFASNLNPGFPFFFSISANAPILAMTGVCIFTFLRNFKLSWEASAFASILYVFGSMALVYSTLSFDISLSTLLILMMFLFLYKAFAEENPLNWLYAGLLLGFSIMTRINTIVFVIPVIYYILQHLITFRSSKDVPAKELGLFSVGVIPFAALILYYNYFRFGSFLCSFAFFVANNLG